MIPLDPHIILVSDDKVSRAAMLLRQGGYLVTKVDAQEALVAIASLAPDAVVVELSAFNVMSFLRMLDRASPSCPSLVITAATALFPARNAVSNAELETELISRVDRLLVETLTAA